MERKHEIAVIGILVAVVMVGLVGVVGATDRFEDNFQYYFSDDPSNEWAYTVDYTYCLSSHNEYVQIVNYQYPYSKSLLFQAYGTRTGGCWVYYKVRFYNTKSSSSPSEYWSFVLRPSSISGYGGVEGSYVDLYLRFRDEIGGIVAEKLIYHDPYGTQIFTNYDENDLWEFIVMEGTMYYRINGVNKGIFNDSCNKNPSYIELYYDIKSGGNPSLYCYIDDLKTKEGIVGIGHETNPNHTITEINNYEIDTSWAVKTIPTADYTTAQYDLKVKRATWGEWYNVTNLKEAGNSSAKPCGFVVYNWSELFNVDDYGLYWFSIYKTDEGEATKIADDWLFFKDIGEDSYINIEETEYAIGSPMNVSYWIGDPDFGANDYWIYMFDSSGGKVDELELYEQGGTHIFTSTVDWEEGTCYSVLIEDTSPNIDKDPPDDIRDLAYDFTLLSSKIIIRGHVWDATNPDNLVDGLPLSNVSVNFSHNNDWYNTTSDSDGYYEFIDSVTLEEMEFYKDIPITVTATKTGYNHGDFTTEVLRAGTYYWDLYLVPNERSEDLDNSSIAGLVLDLPFHQAIGSATVYMQNSTYYTEMTTNKWGFYSTDNIEESHNESFNSTTYASWVSLAHNNIKMGSEVVTEGGATYSEGFDYNMNYTSGTIQALATGNMAEYTDYDIAYDYYAFREVPGLGNNTYNMWTEKETYSGTSKEKVHAHDLTYILENCDSVGFDEVVLDTCDAIINNGNWTSNNTIAVNGTDYMEGTGSLQTVGSQTIDYIKNFTSPVDSNVTKVHGLFYFYARILDKVNISSVNVTVIIGSDGDNSTNTTAWKVNKSYFETDYWNLTILALADGEETGTCNLSAIDYFELKSTKSGNVTTKIDELKFIQWVGWDSNCLELEANTTDKKEGVASVHGEGSGSGYLAKYFLTPLDCSGISEDGALSRIEFWEKVASGGSHFDYVLVSKKDTYNYTQNWSNLTEGDKYGFLYWEDVSVSSSWGTKRLYTNDAYNINFTVNSLEWFEIILGTDYWIDYIQFKEVGRTYHNFYMNQYYNLTVRAKEMDTHNTITDFKAVWDGTEVKETTDGTAIFTNITYGIYALEVTADGFYTSKQYIFMGQDTEETVYLMKIEEGAGGVGLYYPPPHLVEFRVQNVWGSPYPNALVEARGYSTTMGDWDWLYSIFGYKNETQIHNTSMSDTTDSNGQLSFLMVETVKYQINVSDPAARFANKTFWIYPKDERYNLVVGDAIKWQKKGTEELLDIITNSINVTTSEINDTHAYINVSYSDPSNKTTYLAYYLNHTVNNNVEECLSYENWTNISVKQHSFIVSPFKGRAFKVEVDTEHEEWGEQRWTFAVRFQGLLIDLGLPAVAYPMIAIAILLFLGGVFGRSSATQGSLVICFGGWFFLAIGFLSIIPTVVAASALALATVVSIIALMMEKSQRTGVQ